jgi:hypothetical protein
MAPSIIYLDTRLDGNSLAAVLRNMLERNTNAAPELP